MDSEPAKGSEAKAAATPLVAAFGVTLLLAACLNLYVNPFGLYFSKRFDRAQSNFRLLKTELIAKMSPPPRALIIGSSRVFTIAPSDVKALTGKETFNFAMPGAAAEDYYAATRYVTETLGIGIGTVVLGVDYEAFNPAIPSMAEARYFPDYSRLFIHAKRTKNSIGEKLSLLISYQQTEESLNVLRRVLHPGEDTALKAFPDGRADLSGRDKLIASGRFSLAKVLAKRVRKYPERSLHLSGYACADPVRLRYLDDFLAYCRGHGIKVLAYVTPYHPELWSMIDELPASGVLGKVKAELTDAFQAYGVKLHDYSHIESFGGDPALFYDEIHMRPRNQIALMKKLFADEGVSAP